MIRKGTEVRLKGKKQRAKILVVLKDIKGGVRLDRKLGGFEFWNKKDLERAYLTFT
jgi:hypothetical protein